MSEKKPFMLAISIDQKALTELTWTWYPGNEPYFGFDHIWGMVFTCTHRETWIFISLCT